VLCAGLLACAGLSACGGQQQDAQEPSGNFPVQITAASFPASQTISQHSNMVVTVRNVGSKPIPDIAVTVCKVTCVYSPNLPPGEGTSSAAFASTSTQGFLANPSRPVWVVERPPGSCQGQTGYACVSGGAGGGSSANANTWALGRLAPGASRTFAWRVVAVSPGHFTLAYQVGVGLAGKAKAVMSGGGAPQGTFTVTVSAAPAKSYVNNAGRIVTTP
jgi:hypothetical protein